jgi:hypothetical protein
MTPTNWLSASLARTNAAGAAVTATVMLLLVSYQPEAAFLRMNALVLMAAHATLHALTLNSLKFLRTQHFATAQATLARYRDPRRVSHLDLAAAWLGFYTLAPYVAG